MEKKKISLKLLEFQKSVESIKKNATNPHFKQKYADLNQMLAEVKPILNGLGIVIKQPINNNVVSTILEDVESGEQEISSIELVGNLQPQQIGSCITYFRRYTLSSLLALETEDDDAQLTTKTAPQPIQTNPTAQQTDDKKWLNITNQDGVTITKEYANVLSAIEKKTITTLDHVTSVYKMREEVKQQLIKDLANGK